MIKVIDKFTGDDKWVADTRIKEYLAAGYQLADKVESVPAEKKRSRKK